MIRSQPVRQAPLGACLAAAAFPLWLAPTQAVVATITSDADDYARDVMAKFKAAGLNAGDLVRVNDRYCEIVGHRLADQSCARTGRTAQACRDVHGLTEDIAEAGEYLPARKSHAQCRDGFVVAEVVYRKRCLCGGLR